MSLPTTMPASAPITPSGQRARRLAMTWPAPALLAWALAWCIVLAGRLIGGPPALTLALALAAPLPLALACVGRWRRLLVLAGFPVSLALVGGLAAWPGWAWLVLLLPLMLAYPVRVWRDAPFYPSPPDALLGLAGRLDLPAAARVLDAGCGAGHGLVALGRAWPDARREGVEWSWPLALAARARCRRAGARVRRGDLWADDWAGFDLVYLFQRPESMGRAWAKACAQMKPGSWLVSLEFTVPGVAPDVTLASPGARPVHAWRMRAPMRAQPAAGDADIPRKLRPRRRGRA